MKKLFMILPLVLVLCCAFGCEKAEESVEEPAVDIAADVSAIESLLNQVENAWNEGDLDAFMATIADNAVYMPPDEPVLIGKEAIRNWYDFDNFSFDVTINSDEIEVHGDWAFQRSHWNGSWVQKDSGEITRMESKTINIFRRQPEGSWKNSYAIWNFTKRETKKE